MDANRGTLVRDGSSGVATQACLVAAVKPRALLGEFLDLVGREPSPCEAEALSTTQGEAYLVDCRGRAPERPQWSDSTRARLRSSVFPMLAQAGDVEKTRAPTLQTVHIASHVLDDLTDHHEHSVVRGLRVGPGAGLVPRCDGPPLTT